MQVCLPDSDLKLSVDELKLRAIIEKRLCHIHFDSELFGLRVSSVCLFEEEAALAQTFTFLSGLGNQVDLIYVTVAKVEAVSTLDWMKETLMDEKVTFILDLEQMGEETLSSLCQCSDATGVTVQRFPTGEPSEALITLAYEAGAHSRFARDPKLGHEKFTRMYREWCTNSCRREVAMEVFCAYDVEQVDSGKEVGFITVGQKQTRGGMVRADVGLLAVSGSKRGRRVGTQLLATALLWAKTSGFKTAQVVTQDHNVAACKFYERVGFSRDDHVRVYHWWPETNGVS
jgi:dTDP-4-amino-4,6-dideoxy-D-galactose acyltransferase